jgi:hypothetical protein
MRPLRLIKRTVTVTTTTTYTIYWEAAVPAESPTPEPANKLEPTALPEPSPGTQDPSTVSKEAEIMPYDEQTLTCKS